jgi:alanine racemase
MAVLYNQIPRDYIRPVAALSVASPLSKQPSSHPSRRSATQSMIPVFQPAARPIKAVVDLAALAHNVALAKQRSAPAKVLAVVKANAYGHGLARVLPALASADGLALIELESAILLRALGWRKPIVLLEGFFSSSELALFAEHALSTAVHHEAQVEALAAASIPRALDVYIKVNTGMNRLGFAPDAVAQVVSRLRASRAVRSLTLMTHFAAADEIDGIAAPLARFRAVAERFDLPVSLANSAGVLRYGEVGGDVVRPGIMLYGASPSSTPVALLRLKPVMSLMSALIAVQHLAPGDRVGYGGTYRATKPMRIGVVACGYADGYPRQADETTPIDVGGVRTHPMGRVSMDMLAVDITHIPQAEAGTPVELWGKTIPVDEVAAAAGTIGYELLTRVTQRVPFEVTGLTS